MLVWLGLILGLILIGVAVRCEFRSASYGVALSNGVEVLVSPEMYRAILVRYRRGDDPDDLEQWDHAILEVLRPERPQEWRYLVGSLGYHVAGEGPGMRRQRQTVKRSVGSRA